MDNPNGLPFYSFFCIIVILPVRLTQIGTEGQEKLARSSALVVGADGLGSPILTYLAAAGVGRLGIVDSDTAVIS